MCVSKKAAINGLHVGLPSMRCDATRGHRYSRYVGFEIERRENEAHSTGSDECGRLRMLSLMKALHVERGLWWRKANGTSRVFQDRPRVHVPALCHPSTFRTAPESLHHPAPSCMHHLFTNRRIDERPSSFSRVHHYDHFRPSAFVRCRLSRHEVVDILFVRISATARVWWSMKDVHFNSWRT